MSRSSSEPGGFISNERVPRWGRRWATISGMFMFEFIVTAIWEIVAAVSPSFRLRELKLFNKTSKQHSEKETLHVWALYTPEISNLIKQIYEGKHFIRSRREHGTFHSISSFLARIPPPTSGWKIRNTHQPSEHYSKIFRRKHISWYASANFRGITRFEWAKEIIITSKWCWN